MSALGQILADPLTIGEEAAWSPLQNLVYFSEGPLYRINQHEVLATPTCS